jgi:hypothetical protein
MGDIGTGVAAGIRDEIVWACGLLARLHYLIPPEGQSYTQEITSGKGSLLTLIPPFFFLSIGNDDFDTREASVIKLLCYIDQLADLVPPVL